MCKLWVKVLLKGRCRLCMVTRHFIAIWKAGMPVFWSQKRLGGTPTYTKSMVRCLFLSRFWRYSGELDLLITHGPGSLHTHKPPALPSSSFWHLTCSPVFGPGWADSLSFTPLSPASTGPSLSLFAFLSRGRAPMSPVCLPFFLLLPSTELLRVG
ncbi:hypothetical protein CC80DRAFT_13790 [Byssothecium circinans]|uniref:Uncharacterized protein n=1 Tax=Byssothecium circinans TaxID=147558 RepID=A0A6A5UFY2_9PLEO|nr:hypothetical protein CC80DRAFT_13790 [Byssothecium circinans]